MTDKQTIQFQKLYKKTFEEEISKAEALQQGLKFIRLFQLVYQPIKSRKVQERHKKWQTLKHN